MTIMITCPKCAKTIHAPDETCGRVGKCTGCDTRFRIGRPEVATAISESTVSAAVLTKRPVAAKGHSSIANVSSRSGSTTPNFSTPLPPTRSDLQRPTATQTIAAATNWYNLVASALVVGTVLGVILFIISGLIAWKAGLFESSAKPTQFAAAPSAPAAPSTPAVAEPEHAEPAVADLRWLPDDADLVVTVNFERFVTGQLTGKLMKEIEAHKDLKDLAEIIQAFEKEKQEFDNKIYKTEIVPGLGIVPADVRTCQFGMVTTREMSVAVVHFAKPVTSEQIARSQTNSWAQFKEGDQKLYEMEVKGRKVAFMLPDDHTVVGASSLELLRAVLKRKAPAHLSAETTALLKRVDSSKVFTLAFDGTERMKKAEKEPHVKKPNEIDLTEKLPLALQRAHAITLEFDTKSRLVLACSLGCMNADDAAQLKKLVDDGLALTKAATQKKIDESTDATEQKSAKTGLIVIDSVHAVVHDSALTVQLGMDFPQLADLIILARKFAPTKQGAPNHP